MHITLLKSTLLNLSAFISIAFINACNNPAKTSPASSSSNNSLTDTAAVMQLPNITPGADSVSINLSNKSIVTKAIKVSIANGASFFLNIPENYEISVAAQISSRLRFLCKSPDGRLFATDMHNRDDNKKGRVLIFENWNDSTHRFDNVVTYLSNLHNPNQVAFYGGHIYVAETDKLSRFPYKPGDNHPQDSGQVLLRFPDYGLNYKYGGWHLSRSIAFHNNKMYISIGSSCNACVEKEEIRASVIEANPDGSEAHIYARGLRNSVGLKWIGKRLFGTGMGRDLIGPDKPEDVFQEIKRNEFYGWPFYYQYQQKIYADTQFTDLLKPTWVKEPPLAMTGFKAHSAPLGFDYFQAFSDSLLTNRVLVCLHGSTSVWRQRGNAVVMLQANGSYAGVVSGFLSGKTDADRHGRPCDILMNNDHSFFITDDLKGVLYFIYRTN